MIEKLPKATQRSSIDIWSSEIISKSSPNGWSIYRSSIRCQENIKIKHKNTNPTQRSAMNKHNLTGDYHSDHHQNVRPSKRSSMIVI